MRGKTTKSVILKVINLKSVALLTCIFSLTTAYAQDATSAAGGNSTGTGGSVSYTLGQLAYQSHTSTNGTILEGIQLPFEISVITSIEEAFGVTLIISAYPNPVSDHLTLTVNNNNFSNLTYHLFDIDGKLLHTEKIISNQTSINMNNLASSIYLIKVMQNNKEVKTFKISKN